MKNGHEISKYGFKFYPKPNYKVICFKNYANYYDIKQGDIFTFVGIKMCMSIYDGKDDIPCKTLENDNLHYWIGEKEFVKHFIPLAEWRDNQINSILDDDFEG